MKRGSYGAGAALLGAVTALGAWSSSAIAQQASPLMRNYVPVTTAMLENPPAADWLHMSRTYDQHHFSPLTQINRTNVGQLRMVWSRGMGTAGNRQQSVPLVHNGVMYAWAPGDVILALNATNGDLLWKHDPEYDAVGARAKSLGIYQDMIYTNTFDGFIRALDARTGEVRWETQMVGRTGDRNSAGGVLVADSKVLMNGACSEFNPNQPNTTGRNGCYIVALNATTGAEAWKFYTAPADGDPAANTWPAHLKAEQRNASPWGVPGSYDPELRLTYWGTADPKPYPHLTRYATQIGRHDGTPRDCSAPCDLYSNSTLALEIDSGKLRWYFQGLPADSWDADHNQERKLINVMVSPSSNYIKWINPNTRTGVERKLVYYNAEGGGQFALDRATGEFVWGRPFPYDVANLNMNYIDVNTGKTRINFNLVFKKDGDISVGCYHNTRNWWVHAYNPMNNSQYIHFDDFCLRMQADAKQARGYGIRNGEAREGIDPNTLSNLAKVNMTTGEMRILYQSAIPAASATVVTAGGLVFSGDIMGRYRAHDSDSGAVLWETIVGGLISQGNISYQVGGKQYVSIFTGGNGGTGASGIVRGALGAVQDHFAVYTFALP